MSENLTPLRGNAARISFLPCPEGQDARPGVIIGEISCDQCDNAKANVVVGKGPHIYAYHNRHHPQAGEPCGCTLLKLNKPQSANVIRHWTAQRYKKETKPNAAPAQKSTQAPAAPNPVKSAAKPAAAKSAAGTGARATPKPGAGGGIIKPPAGGTERTKLWFEAE